MSKKIGKFEDLDVWQEAIELNVQIFEKFRNCRDYSLKDQICRASVSVASNIAEGFERRYNKEYIQFLYISKGSAGELRTQLIIANRLNIINKDNFEILLDKSKKISA